MSFADEIKQKQDALKRAEKRKLAAEKRTEKRRQAEYAASWRKRRDEEIKEIKELVSKNLDGNTYEKNGIWEVRDHDQTKGAILECGFEIVREWYVPETDHHDGDVGHYTLGGWSMISFKVKR